MTALAVVLSWLGVRDVVRGVVSDHSPPPIAGPVIHASPTTPPGPTSIGVATARPSTAAGEDKAPTPDKSSKSPSKQPGGQGGQGTGDGPKTPGNVRSYATRGGRAALALSDSRVRLISATPDPGYETRVTQAAGWLRVDFLNDRRTSSVIASWYQHSPAVKVYEY